MLIRCPKKDNFGRSTDNMTHHELVMQRCGPVSILASEKMKRPKMTSESEAQMTATLNDLFVISKREFRCSFAILTGATLKNKT